MNSEYEPSGDIKESFMYRSEDDEGGTCSFPVNLVGRLIFPADGWRKRFVLLGVFFAERARVDGWAKLPLLYEKTNSQIVF